MTFHPICTSPEHLVQFVGSHAAAIICEREAELTAFLHHVYPDLFRRHARIRRIVLDTRKKKIEKQRINKGTDERNCSETGIKICLMTGCCSILV